MKEHLIFYVDFLGSKAALHEWDERKLRGIHSALTSSGSIAIRSADFVETPVAEGTRSAITPAVSTFQTTS